MTVNLIKQDEDSLNFIWCYAILQVHQLKSSFENELKTKKKRGRLRSRIELILKTKCIMENLINELKKENQEILKRNPRLAMEFDWTSDAYRLQYNEEMIERLRILTL